MILRVLCIVLAIVFGIVALSSGILAIWLDLLDLNYAASILLAAIGLLCGAMAFGMWKLVRRLHSQDPSYRMHDFSTVRGQSSAHL
jgi:hypothetical protein